MQKNIKEFEILCLMFFVGVSILLVDNMKNEMGPVVLSCFFLLLMFLSYNFSAVIAEKLKNDKNK